MSLSQRTKGMRAERELAKALGGQRVPLSGSAEGYPGDVKALGMTWECKVRQHGFVQLYDWLKDRDALAVRSDRHQWLVVLPLETFLNLLPEPSTTITVEGGKA